MAGVAKVRNAEIEGCLDVVFVWPRNDHISPLLEKNYI